MFRFRKCIFIAPCLLFPHITALGYCRKEDYNLAIKLLEYFYRRETNLVPYSCPEKILCEEKIKSFARIPSGKNTYLEFGIKEIAERVANQIVKECSIMKEMGFEILGIIGIKNSPTCGIGTTKNRGTSSSDIIKFSKNWKELGEREIEFFKNYKVAEINEDGVLFELLRKRLSIPFYAYDKSRSLEENIKELENNFYSENKVN